MNKPKIARVADTQIEAVIRGGDCFFSHIATALGVGVSTIRRRVAKSERLTMAMEEVTELQLDLAESQLMKAVERGEGWAICFFLKCKGKCRGYVERQEVTGRDGGPVVNVGVMAKIPDAELQAIIDCH